jgi:hypothetical protein
MDYLRCELSPIQDMGVLGEPIERSAVRLRSQAPRATRSRLECYPTRRVRPVGLTLPIEDWDRGDNL